MTATTKTMPGRGFVDVATEDAEAARDAYAAAGETLYRKLLIAGGEAVSLSRALRAAHPDATDADIDKEASGFYTRAMTAALTEARESVRLFEPSLFAPSDLDYTLGSDVSGKRAPWRLHE